MIERTEERLGLKPDWLAADTAYGTGKFLGWLSGPSITPHIPVWDKNHRMTAPSHAATSSMTSNATSTSVRRQALATTTGRILSDNTLRYLASTYDCGPCSLKSKCCPNSPHRKIPRDLNEDARDHARALMGTPEFDKSRDERKKVEMRFAHLKTHHHFERMRPARPLPARATSSISPPSCRTSRPWRCAWATAEQMECELDCVNLGRSGCSVRRSGCDAQPEKRKTLPESKGN